MPVDIYTYYVQLLTMSNYSPHINIQMLVLRVSLLVSNEKIPPKSNFLAALRGWSVVAGRGFSLPPNKSEDSVDFLVSSVVFGLSNKK